MAMLGSDDAMTIIINAKNKTSKAFKAVEKNVKTLNKRVANLQPIFQKMAVVGVASFAAVTVGAGKAISKARDFEEETNKFSVVFKDVSKEAQKMADTLNKSYGMSRLESKKLLSSTGDILTGFGFTGKSALDLSSKVNTLAVDLASFTNAQGGSKAVSEALTKALLGERESLKTYGIAISEADVDTELLAMGMGNLTGEAFRQAKAQATLKIAFRQSKNAVGDYARSTGTLTQTQKEIKKTTEDLQIAIGQTLAPIFNNILKKIAPVIEKLKLWIEANPELTRVIIIVVGALAALLAVVGTIGLLLPSLITGFGALISPVGLVIIAVVALIAIGVLLYKNWGKIKELGVKIWGSIKDFFVKTLNTMSELAKKTLDKTRDFFVNIWNGIKDKINGVLEEITNLLSAFYEKWKNWILGIGGAITGLFLPKIVLMSTQFAIQMAKMATAAVINFAKMTATTIVETAKMTATAIANFIKMSISAAVNFAKITATFIVESLKWVASMAMTSAKLIATWTVMAAKSLVQAGRMAASWIIAMGPIAWAVAAIAAITALIIGNWDIISAWTIEKWTQIANFFVEFWNKTILKASESLAKIKEWMKNTSESIKNGWKKTWESIGNIVSSVWEGIKNGIKSSINWIIEKINFFIKQANKVTQIGNKIPGIDIPMIPEIPMLAKGGIVTKPTLAMVGEAGPEAVIPLSKMGSMGGVGFSLTINNPVFRNNEDERRMKQQLDQYFRPLIMNHKLSF